MHDCDAYHNSGMFPVENLENRKKIDNLEKNQRIWRKVFLWLVRWHEMRSSSERENKLQHPTEKIICIST